MESNSVTTHKVSPISQYLTEIVYGGTDGIITTFAIVAGFAGAQAQQVPSLPLFAVLLFGFANLFADGFSMALGSFLSAKSEEDVYVNEERKEKNDIRTQEEIEYEETVAILIQKGFGKSEATELARMYRKNKPFWVEFLMANHIGLQSTRNQNSAIKSLVTFCSFVFFGFIPLVPYVLFFSSTQLFTFSCIAAAIALTILGLLRFYVTKQKMLYAVGQTLLLGITAAFVAYAVGFLFKV